MAPLPFPTFSPFFNAGLLATNPFDDDDEAFDEFDDGLDNYPELGIRRSSLPIDPTPPAISSPSTESSSFYLALQPPRDQSEFRSFLSLDLAESQSLRSVSLRRQTCSTPRSHSRERYSKSTSRSRKHPSARSTHVDRNAAVVLPLATTEPLHLPSKKKIPAREPTRTVPSLPSSSRLPQPTSTDKSRDPSPKSTSDPALDLPPCLPPLPTFNRITPLLSTLSEISLSLTVTTGPRPLSPASSQPPLSMTYHNRSRTLACLEGRSDSPGRVIPKKLHASRSRGRNFMSMGSNEDDASMHIDVHVPTRFTRAPTESDLAPEVEEEDDEWELAALAPRTCVATQLKSDNRAVHSNLDLEESYPGVSFIDWGDEGKTRQSRNKSNRQPKPRNWGNFLEMAGKA